MTRAGTQSLTGRASTELERPPEAARHSPHTLLLSWSLPAL